ncbi:MAG: MBL fold metallo-hydrolase [Nanoarchaeota archaeon]
MIFKQVALGKMQNFSYIMGDSGEAAIVDPGWDVDELIETAEDMKITKIILTHFHFDHVQKTDELADRTKAEIYLYEDEFESLKKVVGSHKVHKLKDNDKIKVGKVKIKVIHTPGHTPGGMCLLVENKLITGDTLFVNAIGRTDLPGGNAPQLFDSLQKLKKLDDKIEVYPGHDYGDVPVSTIAREKKQNPYFMCKSKEDFLKMVGY